MYHVMINVNIKIKRGKIIIEKWTVKNWISYSSAAESQYALAYYIFSKLIDIRTLVSFLKAIPKMLSEGSTKIRIRMNSNELKKVHYSTLKYVY